MPAMKVTPGAAMRARDVSRPDAEHLAWAEEAEANAAAAAGVFAAAGAVAAAGVVAADGGSGQETGSGGRSPVFS